MRFLAMMASMARMCGWLPSFFATFFWISSRETPSAARAQTAPRAKASILADVISKAILLQTTHDLEPKDNKSNRVKLQS